MYIEKKKKKKREAKTSFGKLYNKVLNCDIKKLFDFNLIKIYLVVLSKAKKRTVDDSN